MSLLHAWLATYVMMYVRTYLYIVQMCMNNTYTLRMHMYVPNTITQHDCMEYGYTYVHMIYIIMYDNFRVGGQEKYFHCDKCGFCLDKSMLDTHLCRQDSSNNNCPVCMEVRM